MVLSKVCVHAYCVIMSPFIQYVKENGSPCSQTVDSDMFEVWIKRSTDQLTHTKYISHAAGHIGEIWKQITIGVTVVALPIGRLFPFVSACLRISIADFPVFFSLCFRVSPQWGHEGHRRASHPQGEGRLSLRSDIYSYGARHWYGMILPFTLFFFKWRGVITKEVCVCIAAPQPVILNGIVSSGDSRALKIKCLLFQV